MKKIIAVLFMSLAISCHGGGKTAPPVQEVSAAKVEKGVVERDVLFTGNIVAESAYEVFPRATGKVSKKVLNEGDPVKKGGAILMVDRDEVGYKFRPMPVDSPTDGFVGSILSDVGTNVTPQNPVAIVVEPGNMRVKLDIPERYLPVIDIGTPVTLAVDTLGGKSFGGTIFTKSPVVSEKTRTAKVEIVLPNADGILRHGMFGRMKLAVEKRDGVICVPNDAISWEGDKQFVYRIEDARAKRIEVKTGLRGVSSVEILEGISEGDILAASNLIELSDGEEVVVINK